MADDILRELHRLHEYAQGLQRLMVEAQAKMPPHAEGIDNSGAVRIVLDRAGFPESVRVETDWRRRLDPRDFGGAVVEACTVAARARLVEWTRILEADGWQSKVDRLRARVDQQAPADPVPEMFRATNGDRSGPTAGDSSRPTAGNGARPLPTTGPPGSTGRFAAGGPPRSLDALADDMLRAFDRVDELAKRPKLVAQGTGSVAAGKLVVTLANGALISCTANPQWIAQQSATALSGAIGAAVAAARADLARASAAPDPTVPLNNLFDEAMRVLTDPRRLAES